MVLVKLERSSFGRGDPVMFCHSSYSVGVKGISGCQHAVVDRTEDFIPHKMGFRFCLASFLKNDLFVYLLFNCS